MALYRLRASGTWNGGETWNFGMHANAELTTSAAAAAWGAALTEAWSGAGTPAGALEDYYPADVVLTTATAAERALDTGTQQTRVDVALNLPGTSASEPLPPQVALVVSLRTLVANRAGHGRFYLPAMAVNATAGGRVAAAATTAIVNAVQRMFTSLSSSTITPVLYQQGRLNLYTVTTFNIGDVFDTQRRRRDQLTEVRTSGTV